VNVGNVQEVHLAVLVKLLRFVPFACDLVTEGGHFVASIENYTVGAFLVGFWVRGWVPLGSILGSPISLSIS
jgi:hypothetical protein